MSRLISRQIKQMIAEAERILLLTDARIDGDTIGSTLGMYHLLKAQGKDVSVYSPRPMISSLAFVPGTEVIERGLEALATISPDLCLIFDSSDGEFLGELPEHIRRVPLVVFDHHASNPRYGTVHLIDAEAPSTADVVYRFVKEAGYPLNREASQAILTGILTDTNVLSTPNTTQKTLIATEDLIAHGADMQEIIRETMMNKTEKTFKLWGIALSRLHLNSEFGTVTTVILQKDMEEIGIEEGETKALSNFLNAMIDTDSTLVLKETPEGDVKGSLRSISKNVREIAEKYGGGGHDLAAGFKIPGAYLEEQGGEWKIVRK